MTTSMSRHGAQYYDLSSSNSSSHQSSAENFAAVSGLSQQNLFIADDDENDELHNIHSEKTKEGPKLSSRGILNVLTLAAIAMALLMLFMGYPILVEIQRRLNPYRMGEASAERNTAHFQRGLIDPDTPQSAMSRTSAEDGSSWHLVFSDEFETEGRTFWPGDDPYWEAVDLWYWGTGDYEWYTPEAVNTTGGALTITVEEKETNNLNFRSGMVQSWNKVCFQGAYYEFSAILPGTHTIAGYWPGLWTQGNLGRPGYGATNEGMWPYSYNSCDTGILPNQTYLDGSGPPRALDAHGLFSDSVNNELSWLPGMRFPSCTCPGEDHPGPNNNVARSAPELDILEAKINLESGHGETSQSLQMAPFDIDYYYGNGTGQVRIYDDLTMLNDYKGGEIQQAISALSQVPDEAYEAVSDPQYTTFGVEYEPDWEGNGEGAYATWYMNGRPTWTLYSSSIEAVPELDISRRLVPREPMFMIMNVALSQNFQAPDWDNLEFPAQLKVDYVRVYQRDGRPDRVGCDPPDYPTYDYIERNRDMYYNRNLTEFPKDRIPKNTLTGCN